MAPSSADIV